MQIVCDAATPLFDPDGLRLIHPAPPVPPPRLQVRDLRRIERRRVDWLR